MGSSFVKVNVTPVPAVILTQAAPYKSGAVDVRTSILGYALVRVGPITTSAANTHLAPIFRVEVSDDGLTNWRPARKLSLTRTGAAATNATNIPAGVSSFNPGAAEGVSQMLKPYNVMMCDRLTNATPEFNRIVKWTAAALVEFEDPILNAFPNGIILADAYCYFMGIGLTAVNYVRFVFLNEATDGSDNPITFTMAVDCQFSHVTGIV